MAGNHLGYVRFEWRCARYVMRVASESARGVRLLPETQDFKRLPET